MIISNTFTLSPFQSLFTSKPTVAFYNKKKCRKNTLDLTTFDTNIEITISLGNISYKLLKLTTSSVSRWLTFFLIFI